MKRKLIVLLNLLFVFSIHIVYADNEVDTVYYNLNISDKYEEEIVAVFGGDAYKIADEDESDIPPLEYILLYEKQYPIVSNLKKEYQKDIKKQDGKVLVNLSYTYNKDEFTKATFFNNCFENPKIENNDDYLEISLKGSFYCLHNKRYQIRVTTDYDVTSNGQKDGNTYSWMVSKNKVDINLKINKKSEESKNTEEKKSVNIIVILVGICIVLACLVFVKEKVIKK